MTSYTSARPIDHKAKSSLELLAGNKPPQVAWMHTKAPKESRAPSFDKENVNINILNYQQFQKKPPSQPAQGAGWLQYALNSLDIPELHGILKDKNVLNKNFSYMEVGGPLEVEGVARALTKDQKQMFKQKSRCQGADYRKTFSAGDFSIQSPAYKDLHSAALKVIKCDTSGSLLTDQNLGKGFMPNSKGVFSGKVVLPNQVQKNKYKGIISNNNHKPQYQKKSTLQELSSHNQDKISHNLNMVGNQSTTPQQQPLGKQQMGTVVSGFGTVGNHQPLVMGPASRQGQNGPTQMLGQLMLNSQQKSFMPSHQSHAQQRNASQGSRTGSQGPGPSGQHNNGSYAPNINNVGVLTGKNQERLNSSNARGAAATSISGNVGIIGRCAFGGNSGVATGGRSNPGSLTRQGCQQNPHANNAHLSLNSANMDIQSKTGIGANPTSNNANIETNDYSNTQQSTAMAQSGTKLGQLQNNQVHNTLLQNRKDQTPGNGNSTYQSIATSNKIQKNPSGKELMAHQKLNFGTNNRVEGGASKSVDKAGTSGAAQNGSNYKVNGSGQGQFVNLNSKDANGIGNSNAPNSNIKEKRLSQSQAQQFVNGQYNTNCGSYQGSLQNLANQQVGLISSIGGTQIIIHVCDENKKMNKDFKCDKNLLISNMKYFEKYLSDSKSLDDIDISVHCDINIFDWLMRYIHRKDPTIEIKNSVSILISSDFLQMADLVEEALSFVARNLEEIIQLPIDMNCMNSALIKRLAGKIPLYDLNDLQDKKDKLTSTLFMKKLEFLFEEEHNQLHRCVNCGTLYTGNQREWMQCAKANLFVDFHGNVVAKHQSDKHWDINKFVLFLRQKQVTWPEIFWKMFARLQEFKCTCCDKKFIGAEINHCSIHPQPAKFNYQATEGSYPCCNSKATRFTSGLPEKGCTSQKHRIKTGSPRKTVAQRAKNFELLMEHFKIACEPYYFVREDPYTGTTEKKITYSDMIDEDKALLNLVALFVKQSPKHIQENEAREAREARREAQRKQQELLFEKSQRAHEDPAPDGEQNKASETQNQVLMNCESWEDLSRQPAAFGKDHKDGGEFDLNDELQTMNDLSCFSIFKKRCKKGRKYKEWRIDAVREEDRNQIQFLEKQLQRMRKKEENPVGRRNVAKKNLQGASNNNPVPSNNCGQGCGDQQNNLGANGGQFAGRPSTGGQAAGLGQGGTGGVGLNSSTNMMNIRNRVKLQQQQQRMRSNGKYNNNNNYKK